MSLAHGIQNEFKYNLNPSTELQDPNKTKLVASLLLESFIVTSSDGLQPNSDGLHLVASLLLE